MAKGIVIQITGEGEGARKALEMVQQHLKDVREESTRTGSDVASAMETARAAMASVGIGLGAAEVVGKLRELVRGAIETGVAIGHLAQQTGISTENLSVLKYAADATGIPIEALSKGFKKLSSTLDDYERGGKKSKATLKELGVTGSQVAATQGDMFRVMELVADKFAAMPDGWKKNALATQLFGRAGQELIPVLNQGSAGLDKFRRDAEAAGVVLDEKMVAKMEELHRDSAQFDAAVQGMSLSLTASLSPALMNAAKGMSFVLDKIREYFNLVAGGSNVDVAAVFKTVPDSFLGKSTWGQESAAIATKTAAQEQLAALDQQRDAIAAKHDLSLKEEADYQKKRQALLKQSTEAEQTIARGALVRASDAVTAAQAAANKNKDGVLGSLLGPSGADADVTAAQNAQQQAAARLQKANDDLAQMNKRSSPLDANPTDVNAKLKSDDAFLKARAAQQQQQAISDAAQQKAMDAAALADLESRHQRELIGDKDFYAQKLALQDNALAAQQAALQQRAQVLAALEIRQTQDKTLKRDANGQSAEEVNTATDLLKVETQLADVAARRKGLASGAAAEMSGANREQTLAGLRAAANLERERNQNITAQIALMRQQHELEAEKLDANGDHKAAQQTRETADLIAQKMQIEQINRQIELSEAAVKAQVEQLTDEAAKDPRLKAENAQKIAALNQQEAAQVAALVAQYQALAAAIGDPALIARAKELQSEMAKLNNPEERQTAQFVKTFTGGMDQIAESMAQNAARGKESFSEMVNSMLADLAKLLTKLALLRVQQATAGGASGWGALAQAFGFGGGGAAAGGVGAVVAGSTGQTGFGGLDGFAEGTSDMRGPAVVGEKGPEVWMPPKRGGSIISNSSLAQKLSESGGGGKAPNVSMSIVNNSRQPVTASQPEVDWDSQTREMVTRIILEDHASGGPISQVSQSGS